MKARYERRSSPYSCVGMRSDTATPLASHAVAPQVSWAGELSERLGLRVQSMRLVAGGASKEAWAVDVDGSTLLVRRAGGGVIHEQTLSLEHEFAVLQAAFEAGVRVPRPVAYLGLLAGREAFAMERVEGETIGRRIVK